MRANPEAGQVLFRLLENESLTRDTDINDVYNDPWYFRLISLVDYEKRRKVRAEQKARFGASNTPVVFV